jgi:transcription elongation factor GreA
MKKVPLTVRGAEKLRAELKQLKSEVRPKIIEAIAMAREHGDLRENAEYHAAREHQGLIEARIRDIEAKLAHAEVIDVTSVHANGKIVFGATIELIDDDTGDEITYQIVGEDEADIKAGLISISSPIARALIGKEPGDMVKVQAPRGEKNYEILEVSYV